MNHEYDLPITRPVSVWNKPLKIEPKIFFLNIAKAINKGVQLEFVDAAENFADALVELSSEEKAGQTAWLLIYNALTKALSELLHDSQDLFLRTNLLENTAQDQLCAVLNDHFENLEVGINREFFQRPQQLPLLKEFGKSLEQWLQGFGLSCSEAQALAQRLPDKFALTLHGEWLREPERYACIKTAVETPFTSAALRQRQWLHYHAWLREQVNERMFAEAFSLQSVYVPLRAYYEEKTKEQRGHLISEAEPETKKHVIDLRTELEHWVNHFNADDPVRLISGGPGFGKSSFCKMFAAHIAEQGAVKVLFVPLHLFDLSADLIEAVARFLNQNRYLDGSPLHAKDGEPRLLVIFDGLDEISMQGKAAAQAAQDFTEEVLRKLNGINGQGLQRQIIISGRDLVVQANANKFRNPKQILHILPYLVAENTKENYQDPAQLLSEDQRQQWWRNYGHASGKAYTQMPRELITANLDDITCWPLLNYLVALSYDRQQLDFSAETTLNQVYSDLLQAVYERQYEGNNRKHQGIGSLDSRNFCRILEEIALAVWHGDGRTTTVEYIQSRCEKSSLKRYLEEFQEGAEKGVTRLLTAFYFRQSGEIKGDKTFEFTHKSFGEYLIACRLVRMLEKIQQEWQRHEDDPDDGWDLRKILEHWAEICGPTEIDDYLNQFLQNQIMLAKPDQICQWQLLLCRLIESSVTHGMPMEKLGLKSFQDMQKQAAHAEQALLVMHAACARQTQTVLEISWPTEYSFISWICRMRGQSLGLTTESLCFLDLSACYFGYLDLFDADLSYASLRNIEAPGVILINANFENANLQHAELFDSKLDDANFTRANLRGADFSGARLKDAELSRANLEGANFEGADLSGANLEDANLEGANFGGANLLRANLRGTIRDPSLY